MLNQLKGEREKKKLSSITKETTVKIKNKKKGCRSELKTVVMIKKIAECMKKIRNCKIKILLRLLFFLRSYYWDYLKTDYYCHFHQAKPQKALSWLILRAQF